jgi:acetyl-CoA carboxylase biotin carboxyl carrier protein
MKAPPRDPGATDADAFTIEDVRALAQLACDFDLAELELCRPSGEQLRLRRARGEAEAARPVLAPPAAAAALAPAASPPSQAPAAAEDVRYITSPFVGTFYRAAGPTAAAFVEVGQHVRKGQTLCIIEAMKLMNELEAEFDCAIVECLAQNGRPVEYGERLFAVRA